MGHYETFVGQIKRPESRGGPTRSRNMAEM